MSIVKIKNKVIPRYCNPEKDLQSTSHSHKTQSSHKVPQIRINYLATPNINTRIYDHPHSHDQRVLHQFKTIKHNLQNQFTYRNISWTYTSPGQYNPHHKDTKKILKPESAPLKLSQYPQQNTPQSKQKTKLCYLAQLRKKMINSLSEANTVESKYLISSTPKSIIQQSELVFKGSRDVGKIVPLKLIYGDNQQQITDTDIYKKIYHASRTNFEINLIKKSNDRCSLVSFKPSDILCSLITIVNSFWLEHIFHQSFLDIYYKRKSQKATYLVGQSYQYTLSELYEYKRITKVNVSVICKHLEEGIRILCQQRYSFFDIKGIQKTICYMHGKFKFLPVFTKGKIHVVKNFNEIMKQLQQYLISLSK